MEDVQEATDHVYRAEKVQKTLDLLLKKWPELSPLKDRLRSRFSTVAEDLLVPADEPEELDVFLEELADRSHVWLVAESRKMSPEERTQAVSRLLEISPSNYDDLAWALETIRNHAPLLTGGDEGFNDLVQDLALKIEQGKPVDDLLGTIENKRSIEVSSPFITRSRFSKLSEAEDRLIKTIGKLLGSPNFAAGSYTPLTREKAIATFCNNLIEIMSPEAMETYLEADYLGISRVRLFKVSELISILFILSRSEYLELAFGTIGEDDALGDWLLDEELENTPAACFLADKLAENTAEFAIELAHHYLKSEKEIDDVVNHLDYELNEAIRTRFKLDSLGKSELPKSSDQSIKRGKWTVDLDKSALLHDDHPDDLIRLPNTTRETLWVAFHKVPEGKLRATFDEHELLTEARKRVEGLGKTRKKEMPKRLKDWAFSNDMKILWGKQKLLGSTTRNPEQEDSTGKYLKGKVRIELSVPFRKR